MRSEWNRGLRSTVYTAAKYGGASERTAAGSAGNKFWIATARESHRRMVAVIGVRETRCVHGFRAAAGALDEPRYGLPFAGDNQYLFSRIDVIDEPAGIRWFVPVDDEDQSAESTRLTTNIDRVDGSRTESRVFAPAESAACPPTSWVRVGPSS